VGHGGGEAPGLCRRGGPLFSQGLHRPDRLIQSSTLGSFPTEARGRAGKDSSRAGGQRRGLCGIPGPADPCDPYRKGSAGVKRDLAHQPGGHKVVSCPKVRGKPETCRKKLTEFAETFEPIELSGSAMDLYMRIRPKVPEGKAG